MRVTQKMIDAYIKADATGTGYAGAVAARLQAVLDLIEEEQRKGGMAADSESAEMVLMTRYPSLSLFVGSFFQAAEAQRWLDVALVLHSLLQHRDNEAQRLATELVQVLRSPMLAYPRT